MKRFSVFLCTFLISLSLHSNASDSLTLDVAPQGTISLDDMELNGRNSLGISYNFNSGITAGFSVISLGESNLSTLEIGVKVAKGAHITALTGSDGENLAFGFGLGYDFLKDEDMLFSSVGVYLDYIATNEDKNSSTLSVENGGLFLIGLKTSLGL